MVIMALSTLPLAAQIPAFPGAEGFGAYATGGRGGDVYTVTNLNSSGAGSLRYGVETAPTQGRTIVFAVSGYIPISNNSDTGNKTVRIVRNKVTIAGQTAPGDGIGLKDGRILVTGNNVVLRHLRIRHGKYGGAGDCLNLESSADDSIIDHVSLMFSTDENISFFNSTLDNFTMQYSTSSWGMERHNAGGLWDLKDGTSHHCLWAHHRTRNPKARPFDGVLEWINNVTFHWRSEGFIMGDSQTPANWSANVRGCYYLSIADEDFGLNQKALSKARIASNGLPNFHLYLDNCMHDADGDGLLNGTNKGYGIVDGQPYTPAEGAAPGTVRYGKSPAPFPGASGMATVVIDDPLTAYKKVISSAGALRLDAAHPGPLRDELDQLLIESVETQKSILVAKDTPVDADDPPSNGEAQLALPPYNITNGGFGTLNPAPAPLDSDLDGMPDFWENTLGWNAATQDHNTAMANSGGYVTGPTFFPPSTPVGYTRLEEYLHFLSLPHATIPRNTATHPSSLAVNLRRYTSGFKEAPVTFTFSGISNGSVTLQPDGSTAVFTPTLGFAGRARFNFTVTDGDGSTWTQTFGVLASSDGTPSPAAPADLAAVAANRQVALSWTASPGATSYNVKRSTSGSGNFTTIASPTGTSHVDSGLTNGTTYYYVVTAMNGGNESASSSQTSATPGNVGPQTIQAESGTIAGGVTVDSNNPGWNGTGFTNFPTTGGSLQFNNINGGPGGAGTLTIRFALGIATSRSGNLVVNGVAQPVTFPPSGSWTTWTTMDVPVTLSGGSANTLRFESTGQDLANLDEITVVPRVLPEVTITATDAAAGEFGDDRQLRFTFTRSGGTTAPLTVPIMTAGGATSPDDYTGFTGEVVIPTGAPDADLTLTIQPDEISEGPETVLITLGGSAEFTAGIPDSAIGTIDDAPAQNFYFDTIADPARRAPGDDADDDSLANVIEYFMGSNPADAGSRDTLEIPAASAGSFKVRYPRAADRPDVSGVLKWSPDLKTWFGSGENDGTHTVTFAEEVVSGLGANPETVETTGTITGPGDPPRIFLCLAVE